MYENMTTPHNFAKNTGWGPFDHKKCPREFLPYPLNNHFSTSTLHRNLKQLKPTEEYLFGIFPTVILTDI